MPLTNNTISIRKILRTGASRKSLLPVYARDPFETWGDKPGTWFSAWFRRFSCLLQLERIAKFLLEEPQACEQLIFDPFQRRIAYAVMRLPGICGHIE